MCLASLRRIQWEKITEKNITEQRQEHQVEDLKEKNQNDDDNDNDLFNKYNNNNNNNNNNNDVLLVLLDYKQI
jgi:hypothetical protein